MLASRKLLFLNGFGWEAGIRTPIPWSRGLAMLRELFATSLDGFFRLFRIQFAPPPNQIFAIRPSEIWLDFGHDSHAHARVATVAARLAREVESFGEATETAHTGPTKLTPRETRP